MVVEPVIDSRLEALRARLSGTRPAAAGTIKMCLNVGSRFLAWANKDTPTSEDVDRYFAARRAAGIGERTNKNEFFQLRNLFEANHLDWPFDKHDTPRPKDKPQQPTLTRDQLTALIMAQAKYSPAERLYLAIPTTWASRREALSQLKRRDWDGERLTIPGVHGSETVKHLIPDCLRPLFAAYRLKPHTPQALSQMFHRIVDKASLKLGDGYGWHSIRRTVNTMVLAALPFEKRLLWAYSTGWKKEHIGREFYNSAMAGYYDHPEILDPDSLERDRQIYEVHPLLKLWERTLRESPPVVTVTPEIDTMASETQAAVEMAEKAVAQIAEASAYAPVVSPPMPQGRPRESPLDRLIRELREA